MKNHRTLLTRLALAALLLAAYPAFVLTYTWVHVARAGLPGGRHGPLDAYRHTLASAVVAYTLSPRAVEWVTTAMERSHSAGSAMDRHNNRLGAAIGSNAHAFSDIEPAVRAAVQRGAMQALDADQVTWLPPASWREGWAW